jgi:hypothetical protein
MLRLIREMWGFSPVNKRSQRLANDGSRTKGPRLPTIHIDKNRVKRSARSALVFRQSMGVLLTSGGNFARLRAKLTHMGGHLPVVFTGIESFARGHEENLLKLSPQQAEAWLDLIFHAKQDW